ncbi:uncharacterized protein A4U43_C08F27310 [Asparagus officinalis]|nr:uncharacterized protein A4U43_C08F27310 [Asparagus officinalis]
MKAARGSAARRVYPVVAELAGSHCCGVAEAAGKAGPMYAADADVGVGRCGGKKKAAAVAFYSRRQVRRWYRVAELGCRSAGCRALVAPAIDWRRSAARIYMSNRLLPLI